MADPKAPQTPPATPTKIPDASEDTPATQLEDDYDDLVEVLRDFVPITPDLDE